LSNINAGFLGAFRLQLTDLEGAMWWNDYWPMPWMFMFPVMMIVLMVLCFVMMRFMMHGGRRDRPVDILKERYARGEINQAEYEERRRLLEA
jgi:putative membrane protein